VGWLLEGVFVSVVCLLTILCQQRTGGSFSQWHGTWRSTYLRQFLTPPSYSTSTALPSSSISTPSIYSDVLYLPYLCAAFEPASIFRSSTFKSSIPHRSGSSISPADLPRTPLVLTDLLQSWPAFDSSSDRAWSLDKLARRFPDVRFRAESALVSLDVYTSYHDRCPNDESPLYLFDSQFVENTSGRGAPGLGDDYKVPGAFSDDLFGLLGEKRPDYRWLVSCTGPLCGSDAENSRPNGTCVDNWTSTVGLNISPRPQRDERMECGREWRESLDHVSARCHATRRLCEQRQVSS
jgi:hypothetical protein